MKHLYAILLLCGIALSATAQKKELLEDKEIILSRAAQAFDAALQPGNDLHDAIVKENLIGKYVLQVSFREKGDISSVFVVSAEATTNAPRTVSRTLFTSSICLSKCPRAGSTAPNTLSI